MMIANKMKEMAEAAVKRSFEIYTEKRKRNSGLLAWADITTKVDKVEIINAEE